jgi:hypothetical protein
VRRQTLIDGEAYWFMVCCANECSSMSYGPYFSEEMAQADANIETCEWGHFITQFVPEFVRVMCPVPQFLTDVPSELVDVFRNWTITHNINVHDHPMYKMSAYNVDHGVRGVELEKAFINALLGSSD